jgi:hypothetical protein
VAQIFGTRFHPELKIQYVDEDNDRITVSTELEWQEALRYLEPFPVKRLFLSEGNGVFFKDSPPPVPLFFYEDSAASKQANESSNCNNKSKQEAPKKASWTCPRFGRAGPHFMHRKFGGGKHNQQRHQAHLEALKEAVPRCLGMFFPDGKILPHHLPDFLKDVVQVKLIPNSDNEVDLDVNIPLLRQILFKRGMAMLDAHKYEEGRIAFSALAELSPRDPLVLYNLSCAEALLGNPDSAVSVLSRSVECGYRNLAHLLADPDLDSLRTHTGYLKVVANLKDLHYDASDSQNVNEKDEKKEEVKEEKKSEEVIPLAALRMVEKKPEQQPEKEQEKEKDPKKENAEEKKEEAKIVSEPHQAEMSEVEAKYQTELQLLADMGFIDRQKNLVLLVAMNGDLPNVIHQLF